jgi:hypothetical protein
MFSLAGRQHTQPKSVAAQQSEAILIVNILNVINPIVIPVILLS